MKETDIYILNQSKNHQEIIFYLIDVICKEVDSVEMYYKYMCPFFYFNKKPFCYISINRKNNYVDLGFVKGYQHKNQLNYLIGEKRKNVKSLRYFMIDTIPDEVLRIVINEALSLYK